MNTKAVKSWLRFPTVKHGSCSTSAARWWRRFRPAVVTTLACLLVGMMAPAVLGQFQFQQLKSYSGSDGRFPGPLIEGSDGALYGATATHRANGGGTIFSLNKDGSGYRVLHVIAGPGFPAGESHFEENTFALLEGSDGALYGTMKNTDSVGAAFVFRLNKDGTGFTKLHIFDYTGEGRETLELMQGSDGALYGTVLGDVFRLNKDGTGYTVLSTPAQGIGPIGVLTEASDGALHGIAFTSGYRGDAVVFRLNKNGADYTVLHRFLSDSAVWWQEPRAPLVEARNGTLFGTTTFGGVHHSGTLFQINRDGSGYKVLYNLRASLSLVASDGALYGLTPFGGLDNQGSVFRIGSDGSGFTELFSFRGTNGESPTMLVQGRDGAFYGTTLRGGGLNLGTVFALRPKPILLPPVVSASGVTVRFTSMPNSTHQLQRVTTLDGGWQTLTNMVVPTDGVAQFIDPAPPQPAALYRTIAP